MVGISSPGTAAGWLRAGLVKPPTAVKINSNTAGISHKRK
jgi:hypothetical protein